MSGNIKDVHDDTLKIIYNQVMTEYDVPAFVKFASYELGDFGREDKHIFALPGEKRLPLDTSADIWMSQAYLEKNAHRYSEMDRVFIEKEIKRVAKFAGVDLPQKKKQPKEASFEPGIPLDKFAVSIPVSQIEDQNFLTKCASRGYIYHDNFALYPLDTKENIERCNRVFPMGLDGDFEPLRPKVASALAAAIDKNQLSPAVTYYLPVSKSASIRQLDLRIFKAPKHKEAYEGLKPLIEELKSDEYSVALTRVDKQAGLTLYNNELKNPALYLNGIYDDTPVPEAKIKVAGKELKISLFKEASFDNDLPEIKELIGEPEKLQAYCNNQSTSVQNYIAKKVFR